MKPRRTPNQLLAVLLGTALGFLVFTAHASSSRTQTIALHKGWNAVFLQVAPENLDPAAVFSNTPVTIAATYLARHGSVQFIQNPSAIGWNKDGWGVWYASSRPDAFLSSLQAINGNRAYLLFSQQDYTLNLTGSVAFQAISWKSDSFNLVGFSLDDQSPPTFDKFFSASKAHSPLRIYRLVDGQWTLLTDPVRTAMSSGEAYWVYSKGRSDYQGPLAVNVPAGRLIDFSNTSDSWIDLANQSNDPLSVKIERVSSDATLPLAYTITGITQGSMGSVSVDLPPTYALPSLEPGASTSFWLTLRRERMTRAVQTGLVRITTDVGVQFWIPLKGTRPDLALAH